VHLGVDAGNSKSAALVCRSDGQVIGAGRSSGGDIYGIARPADAVTSVLTCARQAMTSAGVQPAMITTAAFRLAGVDWPEDHAFWRASLATALPELRQVSILNDGFAAIRCGAPSGVAVAIVAGTGSAVAGRGPDGREWSLSWWVQEAVGGFGIGDEALRAVCRAALGLGAQTTLTAAVLNEYQHQDVEAMLHSFTRREHRRPWQDKGRLARAVLAAASAGDPVAAGIVQQQARHFAEYARVAAVKAGFDPARDTVPVVLAGSILTAEHSPVAETLTGLLAIEIPKSRPVLANLPPVAGAALDAIAAAGVIITENTLRAVGRSLPQQDFLQT